MAFFGAKKPLKDRLKDHVGAFTDEKFQSYRNRVALDLAQGLARLASLLLLGAAVLLCVLFISLALAFVLAALLQPWLGRFAYALSFAGLGIVLSLACFGLWQKRQIWLETPIFEQLARSLGYLEDEKENNL